MDLYLLIVGFVTGLLTCLYIWHLSDSRKKTYSGSFVIDLSDPMKDICRLELEEDIESIYSKKQITLSVKTIGDDSQE